MKDRTCRRRLLAGKAGFARERTSWLANRPGLAEALWKWSEEEGMSSSGLASAQYLEEVVESIVKVIRGDLRGSEELSDVAAVAAGPSTHGERLSDDVFVDDVRGGVLETERIKQAHREKVKWSRHMDVWEPVVRKDMKAEGAKAVSLRWIDTDKVDEGRPNYRSHLVV